MASPSGPVKRTRALLRHALGGKPPVIKLVVIGDGFTRRARVAEFLRNTFKGKLLFHEPQRLTITSGNELLSAKADEGERRDDGFD